MFAPDVLPPLVRQAGDKAARAFSTESAATVGVTSSAANPISRNLSAESYDPDAALPAAVAMAAVPSEGIPFEAVIHFTNHSAKPDLMHPWKVNAGKHATHLRLQ